MSKYFFITFVKSISRTQYSDLTLANIEAIGADGGGGEGSGGSTCPTEESRCNHGGFTIGDFVIGGVLQLLPIVHHRMRKIAHR